jgi:hypothetical protein
VAINLLETLDKLEPEYIGAVVLTYTLNLNFFEQLVVPRLDGAGCANVVILSDTYGYDDALKRGASNLRGAGTRYVCSPIQSPGRGVQHAKLILMAGPRRGLLLVGSGNLTLHGYGRNLEQFSQFRLEVSPGGPPSDRDLYPFSVVWELLLRFKQEGLLSAAATDRLEAIGEKAAWLTPPVASAPADLRLWHNMDESIFERLKAYGSLNELQIISPFFDLNAIQTLVRHLQPRVLTIGVDAFQPNLDGAALASQCAAWGCELNLRSLDGRSERRPLHAKVIVGIGDRRAWCTTGSANCTTPALLTAWPNGNLELVAWQRSSNPAAFEAIWQDDLVVVQTREALEVQPSEEPETGKEVESLPLRLVELSYQDGLLSGQFVQLPETPPAERWSLELLNRRETHPIEQRTGSRFEILLDEPLREAEAGRIVVVGEDRLQELSPYRWIDQLAKLERLGQRSYHTRIRERLQTFSGARTLFEELMNFLWERIDPKAIQRECEESTRASSRQRGEQPGDKDAESQPTPSEEFFTDERLSKVIGWRAAGAAPYDRSTLSLRDLLSLALLKLTVETGPTSKDPGETGERHEQEDAAQEEKREKERLDALVWLHDYLSRYCRRYAQRLIEPVFVRKVGPELLLENHYTLGRILLEYADKVLPEIVDRAEGSRKAELNTDFRQCVLLVIGGLVWTAGIGLQGTSAWDEFIASGLPLSTLQDLWQKTQLPALVVLLLSEAWENPPPWSVGLRSRSVVQSFLLARTLIEQIERCAGDRFWVQSAASKPETQNLWGFQRVTDLLTDRDTPYPLDNALARLERLVHYRTPVEEKYAKLFDWWDLHRSHQERAPAAVELVGQLAQEGFSGELQLLRSLPPDAEVRALESGKEHCPVCHLHLPDKVLQTLRLGRLAICPNCCRGGLYWKPVLHID